MTGMHWASVIAMLAWLILAISAIRARRIGASKMVVMGLAWAAIFFLVAMVFAAIGGR